MDEFHFELAAIVEQAEREEGIFQARLRDAKARQAPADFKGLCTECEEPVLSARLSAGYHTCIECAEYLEKRAKLG